MNKIKFWLDGCDISFVAEAPEDITLKQLLKQCDKIRPHWCGCVINTHEVSEFETEIIISYILGALTMCLIEATSKVD